MAIPFTKLKHSKDSKTDRIKAMGPYYDYRKILHSPQMSEDYGLEWQLIRVPKGTDDIADAASMQKEVATAPAEVVSERPARNLDEMIALKIEDELSGKGRITRVHPVLGNDY